MLEDAFLTWDSSVLWDLVEEGAVVLTGHGNRPARGLDEVTLQVAAMWERGRTHVAGAGTVFQSRDTALVLGTDALSVMRRGADRTWRYSICVFSSHLLKGRPLTSGEACG